MFQEQKEIAWGKSWGEWVADGCLQTQVSHGGFPQSKSKDNKDVGKKHMRGSGTQRSFGCVFQ